MNMNCRIADDLLPLYVDGVCSPDSRALLEEHLRTCPACRAGFSRAYLHHLVRQKEMLAGILISQHNIHFLLDLMRRAREAVIAGTYGAFLERWLASPAARDW